MQIAILSAAAVLVGLVISRLFFPVKSSSAGVREKRRTGHTSGSPYHAVSIHPADAHCSPVETIKLKRFLSEEAPGLPLPGCNSENCHCRYVHHADRRTGTRDRRMGDPDAANESGFQGMRERRNAKGRRGSDLQYA